MHSCLDGGVHFSFSNRGSLQEQRSGHAQQVLADGNVVISGGSAANYASLNTMEYFDVASNAWRFIDWNTATGSGQKLSKISNGNLLLTGNGSVAELFKPACVLNLTVSPTSFLFASGGGNGNIVINAPSGCGWTLSRIPSWITLATPAAGVGNGNVSFAVAAASAYGRGAQMRLSNQAIQVNQNPPCSATAVAYLYPQNQSFVSTSSLGNISVSHGTECSWSVSGVPSWMTITAGSSGIGNGTVMYSLSANSGAARSATLSIGGRNFIINQAGTAPVCDAGAVATLAPTSQNFIGDGGGASIVVTHDAACSWTVSGLPSWITVTSGGSGKGNGTVYYTAAANNTGGARSASFTVANKTFSVLQAAIPVAGCNAIRLDANVTLSNTLALTNCSGAGTRGANYYTHIYVFSGTAGQKMSFQLSSSAFDTYLYLKSPSNAVLASNDDGGGGTNSRIPASSGSYTLPVTGTYTVEATSYSPQKTGTYTLLRTVY